MQSDIAMKRPMDQEKPPLTPPAELPLPEALSVEEPAPAPEKKRLDPTRYGDWELNGKCVDF